MEQCEWCGEELYDYEKFCYDGQTVCQKCLDYAFSEEAIIDFAAAFPNWLIEYLNEVYFSSTIDKNMSARAMLTDFVRWCDAEFHAWLKHEDVQNV